MGAADYYTREEERNWRSLRAIKVRILRSGKLEEIEAVSEDPDNKSRVSFSLYYYLVRNFTGPH